MAEVEAVAVLRLALERQTRAIVVEQGPTFPLEMEGVVVAPERLGKQA
jgi:hypothetical protein